VISQKQKTSEYYNLKAKKFYTDTIDVDMSELYVYFCKHLKSNARVLDAGCGSGRDALEFIKMGFKVDAFDSSNEMVKLANEQTGINAVLSNFLDYKSDVTYDGIWCCASLLHIPFNLLETVIKKMATHLKADGIWYVSFKYGNTEREKDGRYFTDLDEKLLQEIIGKIEGLELYSVWQTIDARPNRNDVWLNALIKRHN